MLHVERCGGFQLLFGLPARTAADADADATAAVFTADGAAGVRRFQGLRSNVRTKILC